MEALAILKVVPVGMFVSATHAAGPSITLTTVTVHCKCISFAFRLSVYGRAGCYLVSECNLRWLKAVFLHF